jgi:hypothetical protein
MLVPVNHCPDDILSVHVLRYLEYNHADDEIRSEVFYTFRNWEGGFR